MDFKGDRQDQKARVFAVKNDDKVDPRGDKGGKAGLGGQNELAVYKAKPR